ncbi:unnamed protein product [Symbiodinium sp. KB8]|nr:unnamed protein product [Symbiodinium sp. KB8]
MLNCHVELVSPQELSLSSIANLIRDRTRGSVNDGTARLQKRDSCWDMTEIPVQKELVRPTDLKDCGARLRCQAGLQPPLGSRLPTKMLDLEDTSCPHRVSHLTIAKYRKRLDLVIYWVNRCDTSFAKFTLAKCGLQFFYGKGSFGTFERTLVLHEGSVLSKNLYAVTVVEEGPQVAHGRTAGAALALARNSKERTYPELRQFARCKLVVLALELGSRWSTDAATFVRLLARLRSRAVPASSRGPSILAFTARWSALLSFAAARAFAASLLSLPLGGTANVDGEPPLLSDIFAESSLEPPFASRMA